MTEALPLLLPFLAQGDIDEIALRVATGYKLTNDLMRGSLALSTFAVGMEQRPYILRAMIDFELRKMADTREGFFSDVKWNAARNCRWLHLNKHPLVMTQHYMGGRNYRQAARHAKNREPLAGMNLSLFNDEDAPSFFREGGYIQFLHGGRVKPDFIALVIPTDRQDGYRARSVIPVPEVTDAVMTETIKEELAFQLRHEGAVLDAEENNNYEEGEGELHEKSG